MARAKRKPAAAPLQSTDDGLYVARIQLPDRQIGLILPPKAIREHAPTVWNDSVKSVKGALSYFDGYANTVAMSKAGSKVAQWALDNGLYIPAQDELEAIYRVAKPGKAKNWCYARSGINLSVVPPTYPYTPDFPKQTPRKEFQKGGAEAFEEVYYWTSTQLPDHPGYAFVQVFEYGSQFSGHKSYEYRVCAVRRIEIKN